MTQNTSVSLGGIVMNERVDKEFGVFSKLFGGVEGKKKDFLPCIKLHIYNRLTHAVSTHQILETYSPEIAKYIGAKEMPAERSLYRALERVGKLFPILMLRYQQFISEMGLVDTEQVIDFSSTYLEGTTAELADHGYSRDKRPDKLQINFGIATGINGIPTALTIQKGNVQDKPHMKTMLKVVQHVIPKNSLLIFDTGGNTKKNKEKIRDMGYHYLTLIPKKLNPYFKHIRYYAENWSRRKEFTMNERHYVCVKRNVGETTLYIFYCPQLYDTQIQQKMRKFEREKKKGDALLRKRKNIRFPSEEGWVEMVPHLQKTLFKIENPYITEVEGFFVLESSIDDDPEKILRLYKDRDKAEKFIRAMKEGLELRPVRSWSKWAIIGIFFIVFLTNFLINLTQNLSKNPVVKNVKLLKKFLINLTLTVVYPPNGFRFTILSNVSPQILSIFGDFIRNYEDKSLNLRW